MYFNTDVSKVSAASETLRPILQTTGRHIPKDNIKINGNTATYRGADNSLAELLPDVFYLMVRIFRLMLVLLYVYINSTKILPIMIINRINEHQIFCRFSLFPSWSG